MQINLKCSLDLEQIEDRLAYHPQIIELQLFEQDIENVRRIIETIRMLKGQGIKVYLHHPMKVNGNFLDILSREREVYDFYRYSSQVLDEICVSEDVDCVVHPHYEKCGSGMWDAAGSEDAREKSQQLGEAIQEISQKTHGRFLWENSPRGLFSSLNPYWLTHIVKPFELPICYDISHSFMSYRGDNVKLLQNISDAMPFVRYFHVVDSAGTEVHDALPLGQGSIKWGALKPYITQREYIFEIELADYRDCTPMAESAAYFHQL
ncbi:sugar phosphate isomerase/epimerase family protein [Peribacillus kribbensis]|uniref:sugar phosphate isomerase/epimerase family protein n=1 Tax=Peribacillus kribbensis TaxID=356658 RepID=UPI0004176F18|nr:TIM barrel protein [Peribacillus kribbensis]